MLLHYKFIQQSVYVATRERIENEPRESPAYDSIEREMTF